MVLWENDSLKLISGKVKRIEKEEGVRFTVTLSDDDSEDIQVIFKETTSDHSNYKRLEKVLPKMTDGSPMLLLVRVVGENLIVFTSVFFSGSIENEKFVSAEGKPLFAALGKITKNIKNEAVDANGKKMLRTRMSVFHSGLKNGFVSLFFDDDAAVAANKMFEEKERPCVCVGEVIEKKQIKDNGGTEHITKGVRLSLL